MKIHPVGAKFFDAERQTDMTNLIVSLLCNFANAPDDSHQYTNRKDHEPTEGFDTKWDGWLIVRCTVTMTGCADGDCMVCRKHFNSFNTQCGQM